MDSAPHVSPMDSGRRSYCACSNCSAATGTLFPHTKLISKTTFPPLSNSTDDRTMITDHSLTRWCGQFFHKVSPTKEIWMVTRTCRLDFRLAPCIVYSVTCVHSINPVFSHGVPQSMDVPGVPKASNIVIFVVDGGGTYLRVKTNLSLCAFRHCVPLISTPAPK